MRTADKMTSVMKVTEKTIKKDTRLQNFFAKESERLLKQKTDPQAAPTKAEGTEQIMANIFAFENVEKVDDIQDATKKFADYASIKDIKVRIEATR